MWHGLSRYGELYRFLKREVAQGEGNYRPDEKNTQTMTEGKK
jgi:hypothetical protein